MSIASGPLLLRFDLANTKVWQWIEECCCFGWVSGQPAEDCRASGQG
jgi:hypothetical protein